MCSTIRETPNISNGLRWTDNQQHNWLPYLLQWQWRIDSIYFADFLGKHYSKREIHLALGKKATIHQATTMLAISKNVLVPGLTGDETIIKVSHQSVATIEAQWEGMGDVGSARYDHKGFKLQ